MKPEDCIGKTFKWTSPDLFTYTSLDNPPNTEWFPSGALLTVNGVTDNVDGPAFTCSCGTVNYIHIQKAFLQQVQDGELVLQEDHTGEVYNPYTGEWSFL